MDIKFHTKEYPLNILTNAGKPINKCPGCFRKDCCLLHPKTKFPDLDGNGLNSDKKVGSTVGTRDRVALETKFLELQEEQLKITIGEWMQKVLVCDGSKCSKNCGLCHAKQGEERNASHFHTTVKPGKNVKDAESFTGTWTYVPKK
jgi:hypothetical protein